MELSGLPDVSKPLPWHRGAWARLGEQLVAGRLPHALLLAGAEGTGKGQLALALSRLLLCTQPSDSFNCGQCHACRLSAGGSHGDFDWVQPEEKSRVIKIDQVRQVVSFINQTASFGSRKVVVLYPADAMNINAANALLKALEEPQPGTFLILVCHRLHGVPATIRSRCQIARLPTPDREEASSWLQALPGAGEESVHLLALADGRPLAAERLVREDRVEASAVTRGAVHGVLSGRVTALDAAKLLGETEAGEFLLHLQSALRQLLRGQGAAMLRSPEARAAFALDDEINRLRAALEAGANPNASLLVDSLLVRCEQELGGTLCDDNMEASQGDRRP
jgi:DNA polymerase-3 subunit delta'